MIQCSVERSDNSRLRQPRYVGILYKPEDAVKAKSGMAQV
jgi:hypothetical protein